jgi:hypothetical protein
MSREYLIFGDIEGKLAILRVECTRCERKGRHLSHSVSGSTRLGVRDATSAQ